MKHFNNYLFLLICVLITIPPPSGQNEKSLSDNIIGLIGFSLGEFTNVVYAQNNTDIDAVVSIDGSIAYRGPKLLKEMSQFHPEEIQVPVLLMLQKYGDSLPLDMSYINDLQRSLLYKIQFHELPQLLFSSWALKLFLADEASYAGMSLEGSRFGYERLLLNQLFWQLPLKLPICPFCPVSP